MKPGLVSVVLPVYNGSRYLRQAVESVLGQTYCDVEIVAVDDGSTDNSAALLDVYGDRVHVFRQANCGNVGQVRNAGIERAQGEFIAFLDQDDWWRPEKLERQIAVMRTDERIGLVHTAAELFDEAGAGNLPPLPGVQQQSKFAEDCFEELLLGNPIYNSSVLVRRSVLEDVGGCDLNVPGNTVQDYDLWLRIAAKHRLGFVAEPVTCYRVHAGQGMWDRRAMLHAELDVLLRIRPEAEWRRTLAGCERLGNLCDQLAVAYLDRGDVREARRHFWRAFRTRKSFRQFTRFVVSRLPARIIDRVRSRGHDRPSACSNTALRKLVISR